MAWRIGMRCGDLVLEQVAAKRWYQPWRAAVNDPPDGPGQTETRLARGNRGSRAARPLLTRATTVA